MGRKLDLGQLTEEEEKAILDVIKRDFTVRKVESDRIGNLSKDVEEEEQKQKEVVKEAVQGEVSIDSLCAKCGSKFIWLINPKSQCKGCDLYFCKNKIDCIVYNKVSKKCFCNACLKQRDLHSFASDWFYDKLKGKFRRHGGAKVSRELQKKKKYKTSESDSSPAPSKPPRITLNDSTFGSPPSSVSTTPASVRRQPSDASQSGISKSSKEEINGRIDPPELIIQEEYNEQMDVVVIETRLESAPPPLSTTDIEIQTDNQLIDDKLPEIKEELEAAISKILLPKLDELKQSQIEHQTEVDRQQKVEDAVRLAEEMIDKAFARAMEKHAQRVSFQPGSAHSSFRDSSLREAGTMTETSDSEMDSLSSASGRKRSPKSLPLSERLGSLSPDSLRKSIDQNHSSMTNITQGVVLRKDQLVARAELDSALGEILDEQGVPVNGPNSPQEFSTELKFTAVGGGKKRFPSGELSDSNSSSHDSDQNHEEILTNSENWSTPELQKKPLQFGRASNTISTNSMLSLQSNGKSPYEELEEGSDFDSSEHVHEEQVLASLIRRPDGPTSPQALMSPQIEVFETLPEKKPRLPVEVAVDSELLESISADLNKKSPKIQKEHKPTSPPVMEELIFAVDKTAVECQVPNEEAEVLYDGQPRAKYSHGSDSDSDESGASSSKNSARLNRNSFLQPQRLSQATQEQKIPASQLSYDDDLIADRDDFGDRVAEMLARKQREQQDIPARTPFNVRDSISSMSDDESLKKRDAESSSSSDDENESRTPVPEERKPGIEESAVGLRMVNDKSLEVLTDALERIEDVKKSDGSRSHSESSSSRSSRTCSVHGDAEEIHKLNEAEEAVYKNAAETYAMEERLDQMERVATGLNRSDPGLKQMLNDLDEEIERAESQVEEIKHGGKSIDAIMQELRGAGLQVERGGYKRTSLDSAPSTYNQEKKPQPGRQSLPPMSKPLHPVNAPDSNQTSWQKNTFTIIPGSRSVPIEEPILHSTSKQRDSSSSESSDSSGPSTPTRRLPPSARPRGFQLETKEPTELQTVLSPPLKSPSGSERSEEHTLNDEEILRTAKRHFSQEEELGVSAQIRSPSAHSSNSNHSAGSSHVKEIAQALEQTRPSSAHSSHSSHSKASSHRAEENIEAEATAATIPVLIKLRSSSTHSSHSSASSQHDDETSEALEKLRPSSARSTQSSHSTASSHHAEKTLAQEQQRPSSAHSSLSSHSAASSHLVEEVVEAKASEGVEAVLPASKSPSAHSTHSSSSTHSKDLEGKVSASSKSPSIQSAHSLYSANSQEELVASVSERRKVFENGGGSAELKSPSSHSSTSSHSSAHRSMNGEAKLMLNGNTNNSGHVKVAVIPPLEASVSSHSATSLRSGTTTSSSVHSDVDEELSRITYQAGLSAEELEEARVPTPVPRTKREVIQIEEVTVLPAPAPRERKHDETTEYHEKTEELLPAADVRVMVDRFEEKKSSSSSSKSSSSGSGTEHAEPRIKEGKAETLNAQERNLELEEQGRKKVLKRRKLLQHQPASSESENSEASEAKNKRRSRIMKDDSWMKNGKKDSDDELEESASRISVGTNRSNRSGMFHNLSASEQREMARIALLHCEETAIAEDRYKTRKINVVRKIEKPVSSSSVEKQAAPALQVSPSVPKVVIQEQTEILPTQAPDDIRTVAEVHRERSSSTSSGSSTESAKNSSKRTTVATPASSHRENSQRQDYNGNSSAAKNSPSRNTLHVMESPSDLDRSQNVRGSITMRGGKMLMTSSPDSGPEFQEPMT